ncbi:chromosome partitioning protein ParA [Mucilaginibacter sp. RS28]|uniref:Chromosome partitioning protein ParA n=1 Tax=Mucilaginibacter straminoryzae TaxID=2932774 RepID=A0A9X1X387_9SPHI|nr:7TM diverse intracellular signaling domain-containing protein [Mucilaginibacter straminoryzae]MCJ8210447.1 chromosome partitioning protein ParA [Mucilaginibacter straminoryzae]
MRILLRRYFWFQKAILVNVVLFLGLAAHAQQVLDVNNQLEQHKFIAGEIATLEDATGKLSFTDIISNNYQQKFRENNLHYPTNHHVKATYWYRVKLRFDSLDANQISLFEFFDQTTDHVTAYIPDAQGKYQASTSGAGVNFYNRLFQHKNFHFLIKNNSPGEYTYYFRLRSANPVNVIIVYRTLSYFIYYALNEYLTFGLFYGMILIFCLHNLLMFLAVKRRQYLYYVFYILSVGFYEMCVDGIAFQYLWPNKPWLNAYGYGTALYLLSMFALVFTKELLQVKQRVRRLAKLIDYILVLRTVYFLVCLFFNKGLFIYKFVEFIPLSLAFLTGIRIYRNGFKPARFFVLAYTFLFLGFSIKALSALGMLWFLPAPINYYSLSFCFVIEMVLLSFAIGDQVRLLRKEKDEARDETIRQMQINSELKDSINQELERQVEVRTREVVEKSEEILAQAHTIEEQNEQLMEINRLLEQQAAEITRMNVLLEKDNHQLKTNISKVIDARVESTEMNFEEFSAKYPDQEACYKFLSDLKWKNGYKCTRCEHTTYCTGRVAYSRRCTKCSYEESPMHNTIFQNNRISINKAFYLVYLMYTSKGTISSHQLSEKLGIRQSTCWTYAIRIKKVMQEQKRARKKGAPQGWSALVLSAEMQDI